MLTHDDIYTPEECKPDPLPIPDLWEAIQDVSILFQGSIGTGYEDEASDRNRLDWLCEARDAVLSFLTRE